MFVICRNKRRGRRTFLTLPLLHQRFEVKDGEEELAIPRTTLRGDSWVPRETMASVTAGRANERIRNEMKKRVKGQ